MISNLKYKPYLSFLRMQESGFYSTLPGRDEIPAFAGMTESCWIPTFTRLTDSGEIPAFAGMTIIPLNDNQFYRIIIN